ncbi:hypothetical protein F5884DRAFT_903878 [Xylogone sp. PMI_703]|nr:hypothetical protein F5884DRAFT_903878 [Xylogone sp. PMI_703]
MRQRNCCVIPPLALRELPNSKDRCAPRVLATVQDAVRSDNWVEAEHRNWNRSLKVHPDSAGRARDTRTFATEDQRHRLATIPLLSIFTGARPAELVDGMKHNAPVKYPWDHSERPDVDGPDPPEDKEALDALYDEQLGFEQHLEDPDYDRLEPWHNAKDTITTKSHMIKTRETTL